jgi:hypothetical protein
MLNKIILKSYYFYNFMVPVVPKWFPTLQKHFIKRYKEKNDKIKRTLFYATSNQEYIKRNGHL